MPRLKTLGWTAFAAGIILSTQWYDMMGVPLGGVA